MLDRRRRHARFARAAQRGTDALDRPFRGAPAAWPPGRKVTTVRARAGAATCSTTHVVVGAGAAGGRASEPEATPVLAGRLSVRSPIPQSRHRTGGLADGLVEAARMAQGAASALRTAATNSASGAPLRREVRASTRPWASIRLITLEWLNSPSSSFLYCTSSAAARPRAPAGLLDAVSAATGACHC